MITTLPGLYLLSVGVIKPVMWLVGWTGTAMCSTAMLRFINVLFNCGNLYILYLLICRIHPKDKSRATGRRVLSAISLSSFPVLYFFTFLYYTDAGSTFFTLFAYLMCLYRCHKASALLGICSILFRQTNIIWVAFCAGTVVAQKMDEAWRVDQSKKKDEKSASQISLQRLAHFLPKYLTSPVNIKSVLLSTWPYGVVALGFIVFVVLNAGIVVGDRSNHEACLNAPQLFYFFSFTLIFSLPISLCYHRLVRFVQSLQRHPFLFLLITVLSVILVWKFTFVHQYLLADNRHFPFYVWKRIFQKHELVRFLLVPAYVFAAWSFMDTLNSKSAFWILAFCVCLVAATVPQKLLEFRYFILPYLLYRIHVPLSSLPRLLLEFALYAAVNAATIYIFIQKTFQWPDSPAVQRFMW
ncbi:dol-P-Glc:Glc(2)Man(9)GlcNAc(2)-PP-Dol alpha-1,2-glucosyltransferase isoform X2 [Ictalurus punctatus]|nr:dol-P-Glc:Glc(2)Man(9)GlcNAc(2)-PP-Dol alpha-1,2-glucosyltransferase isoform X2 [Ictalurus punctatus]